MNKSGSFNATHTAGALTLWYILHQVGSLYPLLGMNPPQLPKKYLDILRKLSIVLRVVETLQPPVRKWRTSPEDTRFADTWIKLRVLELVEFSVRHP